MIDRKQWTSALAAAAVAAFASAQIPQPALPPPPTLPASPMLPSNLTPKLQLPPLPTFASAALREASVGAAVLELRNVADIEEVEGFCREATGNRVCRLLKEGYFAEANGLIAQSCRVSGAAPTLLLTCTLSGPLNPGNGAAVTVKLGRPALSAVTTSKTYSAYRCKPELASVTRSGNLFTLSGTDLILAMLMPKLLQAM